MRVLRFQPHKGLLSAGVASAFLSLLCAAVAFGQPGSSSRAQSCLAAARKALGPQAEVLKCGDLTGNNVLETVAATRIKRFHTTEKGVPISKLVVLRSDKPDWDVELTVADRVMRNQVGYVAMDYIDDLPSSRRAYAGYLVNFSNTLDLLVLRNIITLTY